MTVRVYQSDHHSRMGLLRRRSTFAQSWSTAFLTPGWRQCSFARGPTIARLAGTVGRSGAWASDHTMPGASPTGLIPAGSALRCVPGVIVTPSLQGGTYGQGHVR